MYNNAREQRIKIFNNTRKLYKSNEQLIRDVEHSKSHQRVIAENDNIAGSVDKFNTNATIIVSKKRSLEAASGYTDEKVCVLNFASATNPGGGVENGSNAQEESICRCSTLFACISDADVTSTFHQKHRADLKSGKINALYNDDCIYTPDVTVFKTDTAQPELLSEKDWYKINVITCAAPNLRSKPSNAMNPGSGDTGVSINNSELLELHMKRMRRILEIAKSNGAEVIILGAFGCGAFQNPPEIVAEAMAQVIKEYMCAFKVIEFAVYCSPKDTKNYDVFKRRLLEKDE